MSLSKPLIFPGRRLTYFRMYLAQLIVFFVKRRFNWFVEAENIKFGKAVSLTELVLHFMMWYAFFLELSVGNIAEYFANMLENGPVSHEVNQAQTWHA